mgnify:CR=1 FL=1
MRSVVQKWGNSLAVRVPKAFALALALGPDSPVELVVEDGRLVVSPAPRWTLAELVAGITEDNRHDAVDTGPPRGGEEW